MAQKIKFRGLDATLATYSKAKLEGLELHPACAIFPPLDEDAMETLTTSIGKGFDEGQPIIVDKKTGKLVDGRHRRDIVVHLGDGAPVALVEFPDEKTVQEFVIGSNLGRRHLNAKQRKELKVSLYNMGMKVKDIAKAVGETPQNVSHALKETRAAEVNTKKATVRDEIAKGATPEAAAKKAGVSATTARREAKKPSAPKVVKLPSSNKTVPNTGSPPKFKGEEVNKVWQVKGIHPMHAAVFHKAITSQVNPVPVDQQVALAQRVLAGMTNEQKADKTKGEMAIVAAVRKEYPTERPKAPPAAAPTNVVPMVQKPAAPTVNVTVPLVPLDKAVLVVDVQAARLLACKLEPKTMEQAIKLALELHSEANGQFMPAMEALAYLVLASFAEKGTMVREDRLKALLAAVTAKPAAAAPAPAPAKAAEKPAEAPAKAAAAPAPAKAPAPAGEAGKAAAAPAKADKPAAADGKPEVKK